MNLQNFLLHFDFDFLLYGDEIQLVDLQRANLGDIESERFPKDNLSLIIDRLDIYYEGYIFDGLSASLEEEYNIKTDNWMEIYNHIKRLELDWDMDILPYIMGEKELSLF